MKVRNIHWQTGIAALVLLAAAACGGGSKTTPSIFDVGDLHEETRGGDATLEVTPEDGVGDAGDVDLYGNLDVMVSESLTGCLEEPFAFGCPCSSNGQCFGGFCVESVFGFICTQECVEECPDPAYECKGMSGFGPDVVFLCIPKSVPVCEECEIDSQCGDGVCATIGNAKRCAAVCDDGKSCAENFYCDEEANPPVCVPASDDCDCIEITDGALRSCEVVNEFGVCEGVEICDVAAGWSDCSAGEPSDEICDGLDNDCNGSIDDGLSEPPVCGEGTCTAVGVCLGSLGWKCDAPDATDEVCDFMDNDCDGEVDEDFKVDGKYVDINHCGTCNHDCTNTIANATEICSGETETPQCVVGECDEGYFPWNAYQCLPEGQVLCKPCTGDMECSGGKCLDVFGGSFCSESCDVDPCEQGFLCKVVDGVEGMWCLPVTDTCDCFAALGGIEQPCFVETEAGMCSGMQTCHPINGWSLCDAPEPSEEFCDGLDNDCNGIPDDGLGGAQPCETTVPGVGTCTGTQYCAGAPGWVCNAAIPKMETCDYVDNDCDDTVDEDFVINGKYATLHHCGGCNIECEGAFPDATAFCDVVPAVPLCKVETCDDGYFMLNDFQCIPAQAVECKPCETDEECYFAQCVQLGDGEYCLNPCDDGACEDGTTCETLEVFGDICVPNSGTCLCTAANAGAQKGCSVSNELGTCFGYETCDPASGWGECDAAEPAIEVCDGADNDCDGVADDDLPLFQDCEVSNEWGTCEAQEICLGTQGWVCQAATPAEDVCNYLDDNCDGVVDEDFVTGGKYTLLENCGTCGNNCVGFIANATAKCDSAYLLPKCVVDICDPGYYEANTTECLVKPDTTCEPCANDAQCFGGFCVEIDEVQRCAIPCVTDDDCFGENACLEYPDVGLLCQPVSGSCECNSQSAGQNRPCAETNELGTCTGFQTCDPATGWSPCSALPPSEEVCDGLDNDCNGQVDELFVPFTVECSNENEWGVCTGWLDCQGQAGEVCLAEVPGPEECNYIDDNCDDTVDEGFVVDGKYVTKEHCGSCTNDCTGSIANGTATCDPGYATPKCVVDLCDEGYYQANPFECLPTPDTTCEPCDVDADCLGGVCIEVDEKLRCAITCVLDADCSGETACVEHPEEGLVCQPVSGSCECNTGTAGSKQACDMTNELGTCLGFETCDPVTGWSECSALVPSEETCNGVDDDCNGQIDDGLPGEQDCESSNEFGTCPGTASCAGALGWLCQAPDAEPEICDYKDNNCDGAVDEGFTQDGAYVLFDHCGACNTSCAAGFPNATTICDGAAEPPECVVDQCEPGYVKINKYQCVNVVGNICSPCAVDADCLMDGAICVPLADGSYCTHACTENQDCPAGFSCEVSGDAGMVCIPQNNSCTCTPLVLDTVAPLETCVGGTTLIITGDGFSSGTKVYLGQVEADSITVGSPTDMEAWFSDLQIGTYALTITNGGLCVETIPDAINVIPEPNLYFVDPPVAYNGISIQVTAFVTNIMGGGVTFFGIRPSGTEDPFIPLDYTFAPETPRRVKAVVPEGLAPGNYDVYLEDAPDCGALLVEGLVITDTISVNPVGVQPSFGWTNARTPVNLFAEPNVAENLSGFKSLPRAYLNPANPGPGVLASSLESIGFVDETRVTAAVPEGLQVGKYDLVVVNPDGGVGLLDDAFTVTLMVPPVVDTASPGSVPNNVNPTVTIYGSNFFGPFVGLDCKSPAGVEESFNAMVSSWDSTSIVSEFPTKGLAAGSVCLVTVTNADGAYWTWSALGITNPSENLQPMETMSTMVTPRRAPAVVVGQASSSARFLYAIGGDDGTTAGAHSSVEAAALDPYGELGPWQNLTGALPQQRTLAAAYQAGHYVYVAGGDNGQGPVASVLRTRILSSEGAPLLDDLTLDLGDEGLGQGVWFYRVSAVMAETDPDNPGGESLPSDPLPVLSPLGLPGLLVPTIYWHEVSGAVSYRIYRSPTAGLAAGNEEFVAAVGGAVFSWTDEGVTSQAGIVPKAIGDLGAWYPMPPLNQARSGLGFAWAQDPEDPSVSYLYAVGGLGVGGEPLTTYEVITLDNDTGLPSPGGVWTEVMDNTLSVGRWQYPLYLVDGAATNHVAAGETWLIAGSGMGPGLVPVTNVDGAQVQAGGLLSTWTATTDLAPAFVGCGYAAAANQLWAFGGQNALASTSAKSASLCGIGTSCGDLPALGGWNAGISLSEARYLMGSTVGAAHIIIVGGVNALGQALSSVEGTVW